MRVGEIVVIAECLADYSLCLAVVAAACREKRFYLCENIRRNRELTVCGKFAVKVSYKLIVAARKVEKKSFEVL